MNDLSKSQTIKQTSTQIGKAGGGNQRIAYYGFTDTVYPLFSPPSSDMNAAYAATTASGTRIDTPIFGTRDGHEKDTDFEAAMTAMAPLIPASGDGRSAATASQVLIIVTDGVDHPSGGPSAGIKPKACAALKNGGVHIMTLYTQYYPVYAILPTSLDPQSSSAQGQYQYTYENQVMPITAPMGSSTVEAALQACASPSNTGSGQDYFVASDSLSIDQALKAMLQAASASAGRYTR